VKNINKYGLPEQVLGSTVHKKEHDERVTNGRPQSEDDRIKLLVDEWLVPALVTAFIQERKIDRHLEMIPKRENSNEKMT